MAFALTTVPRDARRRGGGEIIAFPMKAATQIYKGDIVALDITDGHCWSLQATASMAAGDFFAGVAAESKLSGAVAGVDYIRCYISGTFEFLADEVLAQTDMGVVIYGQTDGTGSPKTVRKTVTAGVDLQVGKLVGFEDGTVTRPLVRIDNYAALVGTGA